jgi:hypothetical protein
MKEKRKRARKGSQSISQKGEGKFNKKAKENHPEATDLDHWVRATPLKVNHHVPKIC